MRPTVTTRGRVLGLRPSIVAKRCHPQIQCPISMPRPMAKHCAEEVAAVHAVLKEKLRAAGPGTVRETEAALFYRGYIRNHRHRRVLDLGALLAILKRLKISPREFFAEVAAKLGTDFDGFEDEPDGGSEPDPEPEPMASDDPDVTPSGVPDIKDLTARKVLRKLGADLPVYGDFDE